MTENFTLESFDSHSQHVEDAIVLSYHNTCIRVSDLMLLMPVPEKSPQSRKNDRWLNDVVVSFAFEYFEYNTFHEHADSMAFLNPSVAQLLKLSLMAEDEINEITFLLDPLDLRCKHIIFVPINDHDSYHDSGGTHWSLAVFCIDQPTFMDKETSLDPESYMDINANCPYILPIRVYHYDSHLGISTNFKQAHRLAQKLIPYLVGSCNAQWINTPNNTSSSDSSPIKKQENLSATRTSTRLFHKSLQRQYHNSSSNINTFFNAAENNASPSLNYGHYIPTGGLGNSINQLVQEVTKCPQQVNGFDCGMYCIALAEKVGQEYVSYLSRCQVETTKSHDKFIPPFVTNLTRRSQATDQSPKNGFSSKVTVKNDKEELANYIASISPDYIARKRTELYELILQLTNKKCKINANFVKINDLPGNS